MTEVDRAPCRLCGADVEVRAELLADTLGTSAPRYRTVRTCTSLLCPSNLEGQDLTDSAARTA